MPRELQNPTDPFIEPITRMAVDVSYLGPPDSFSGVIANRLFGHNPVWPISRHPTLIPRKSIDDVLADVQHIPGAFGVLPYENSKTEPLLDVVQALFSLDFRVIHEAKLRVNLMLAGPGASLEDVREIYSHEKAIKQAHSFLSKGDYITVPIDSTSAAAEKVAAMRDKKVAAVCGKTAANRCGLTIIRENIQDIKNNKTRFLVIRAADVNELPDLDFLRSRAFRDTKRSAKIMGVASPVKPASQNGFNEMANFMISWNLVVMAPRGIRNNESLDDDDHEDYLLEFIGKPANLLEAFGNPDTYRHIMQFKRLGVFPVGFVYTE
ncbi:MAG TPA: prephenate dehydratase domain-containing protein [Candidatus Saccharimonadales bacterium]|nr:prephenate dehydratase domain-containing protein [Candidatus Saccharimonadales bacterium]